MLREPNGHMLVVIYQEGDRKVKILADGWTAVTLDNSRTAQKEHTVLIKLSYLFLRESSWN